VLQDLAQLIPFFFTYQKIMRKNQNIEMWNMRFLNVKRMKMRIMEKKIFKNKV
jgi:hypothetical protein